MFRLYPSLIRTPPLPLPQVEIQIAKKNHPTQLEGVGWGGEGRDDRWKITGRGRKDVGGLWLCVGVK